MKNEVNRAFEAKKTKYTIKNFAKRLVMVLAVGLMAVNVWGDTTVSSSSFSNLSGNIQSDANISYSTGNGDATTATAIDGTSIKLYRSTSTNAGGILLLTANNGVKIKSFTITFTGVLGYRSAANTTTAAKTSYTSLTSGTAVSNLDLSSVQIGNIATGKTQAFVSAISVTYATACSKSVTVTSGTSSTNGSISTITGSPVATCDASASNRTVTITVSPNTGYVAPTNLTFSVTSGSAVTATKESGPTDNVYVYSFAQNDNNSTCKVNVACVGKQCTLIFDQNGGTGGQTSNLTATYGSAMPAISGVPTRTHYDFAGYYDGAGGTGNKYYNADGTSATNWNKNTTANTTLYAKWTEHSLTNYRTTCTACEAPNHVDISGAWDRFGGETISLTATAYSTAGTSNPIDAGDITGWQWQKYNGSGWDNVTNGTSAGTTISGATTKNLQITNCGGGNSGSYRCTASTGATCSTSSDGYQVKVYVLESYNGGTTVYNFTRDGANQRGSVEISLTASTAYTFKVHADNDYYGNDGTVNEDVTNWVMCNNSTTACTTNLTVNSGLGGTFTFTMDYSTSGSSSVEGEPELSITYPRKTIYLTPGVWNTGGAKFAFYYFRDGGSSGWTDFITANDCGSSADIPQWNGVKINAVRLSNECSSPNWSDKWNQTSDITITSNNSVSITDWGPDKGDSPYDYGTYAVPTYTISYAKGSVPTGGGSISGSKDSETKTCGVDFTLPSSAVFSTTGYTQTGWATSDGGSQAYAFSGSYTTNAAQAFYPAWTPKQTTVSFNQNGGDGGQTGTVTATYGSAMPSTPVTCPTKTGYTFGGYYDGEGGTGTQYYTNTGASARSWDKVDATYTLYAKWTAKRTTVSFNQNGGTGGQTSSVTATYDAAMPTPITTPTLEGHTFGGYYENSGGTGTKYYNADGTSAQNWDKVDATWTLYAKWNVNNYTISWVTDGDELTGSYTTGSVAYGSAITAPNTPTKTGYTFAGWHNGTSIVEPVTTMPASSITYTAQWTANDYNVAVQTISYVTIKVILPDKSEISEGNNDDVAYNTTIKLNHGSVTSGHGQWGGWRVTKADDASVVVCSSTENNVTFPMPAYDVTVTAYIYSDAIAWCDPDVTVTGDVHLTSTKDVFVHTTSGADNLLNVASTDLGSATSMDIAYLNADAADAEVDKAASAFRLYASDASAAIDASSSSVDISAARTFDTDYSMRYTPTAYSQYNNYKLQLTFKKGDKVLKTVKKPIYGRGLPEEFVIAVKKGDIWVALPNDLATTSAQPAIVPLPITVNNTTTPTEAVYTPINTVYKAMNRGNDSHISTIRFTTTGSNYLQVSGSSEYNMWLSTTNSPNVQDWQLKSSDNSAYELTIPSNNATKKMGIYNSTYMGYHGSPNNAEIYILPITNKIIELPATVTEWGQKSLVLDVNAASYASAQAHIGNGAIEEATSFAQTCTSVKGSPSTNNYTLSFSTTDFSENKGALLYIDWLDGGGDVQSTSTLTIPWIIATNSTMGAIDNVQAHWKDWEVHVLPGVTLEADGNSFSAASNVAKVKTLEIYPGAIVKVTSGTLDVSQDLVLRYGWTRAGSKDYNVAQLQIKRGGSGANLTTNNVYADWYIDYDQYYSIAVPWKVTVANITYLNSANAASAGMKLRYYDGEQRASTGQSQVGQNWKEYSPLPTYLEPSKGYALSARRPTGKAFSILRMPLTIPSSSWTALGEQGEVSGTHKDQVSVTGWGYDTADWYAMGWNFIGNPYMSTFNGNDDGISGKIEYQDGGSVRYATIPDLDFQNYYQVNITEANLKPASGFFIQANNASAQNVTFNADKIVNPSMPSRYLRETAIPEQEAYIRLSYEGGKDQMGIIIGDEYTEAYEPNADLAKVLGEDGFVRTYMHYTEMDMAYVAINETLAKELIPVTVQLPVAGEYTFSLTNSSVVENMEGIYLIDYANNGKITNLIEEDYIFTGEAGTYTDRFVINGVVGHRNTPEGVDAVDANTDTTKPVKFLYRDKIYILNQGVIYDATGKKVREINK